MPENKQNIQLIEISLKQKYKDKIAQIIERLENNHFKWYIILLSVFLANTTANAGFININNPIARNLIISMISCAFLVISFVCLYNSNKYLLMGRCFREIEKKQDINDFNWKKQLNSKTKKWGFVQYSGLIFSILIFLEFIVFISVSLFLL